MKSMISKALVFAAMIAVMAGLSPAAAADAPAEKAKTGAGKPMARKAPPSIPAQLKAKLGLTDDQMSKLNQTLRKNAEDERIQMDQGKLDMDTLVQKLNNNASDSEIGKSLDSVFANQKKMDALRQAKNEDLRSILTPTQMAKFMLIRVRRPMPPKGEHKGKKAAAPKAPAADGADKK